MNARKIPVTRVGQSGASGSPEAFETHFARKRQKGSGRVVRENAPKLKPIENRSMAERLQDHGIVEES